MRQSVTPLVVTDAASLYVSTTYEVVLWTCHCSIYPGESGCWRRKMPMKTMKKLLLQQLQDVSRIPMICFLLPYMAGTNLRCIADPYFLVEFLQYCHNP